MQRCLPYSKPFLRCAGQGVPVAELPDSPGVEAFLLQHVALVGLDQLAGDLAAGVPAADKGQAADVVAEHQRRRQPRPRAAEQGDRQVAAAHERGRQGQRAQATVGRCLGDHRIAGQELDQHGVDEHAQWVVPGGDVGDRAGQWLAAGQHRLDLLQVPAHPAHGAVNRGQRLAPGLADLPDQQQREQLAVLFEQVHATGDAGPPLIQVDPGPLLVLGVGRGHGLQGLAELEHRRPGDRLAVDGAGGLGRITGRLPVTVPQVAYPISLERFRSDLTCTPVGILPARTLPDSSGSSSRHQRSPLLRSGKTHYERIPQACRT